MELICIHINTLEDIKSLLEIIAILIGAYVLIFIYLGFHPIMDLDMEAEWLDEKEELLLVKIQIKNISKVKCRKHNVLIQFLEYDINVNNILTDWVPFKENDDKGCPPKKWKKPLEIAETTRFWYPNDSVKIERCFKCTEGQFYKIGLQLNAKISIFHAIPKYFTNWFNWKTKESWTITKIIYRKQL